MKTVEIAVKELTNYKILKKTGRLANGNERDAGSIYHIVGNNHIALCGTKPGRLSDWSLHEGLKQLVLDV